MKLQKWKIAELAVFFVERELASGAADIQVEHDVRLPDRVNGELRQVDVAIRYKINGRAHLRTVEIQDRGRKIGSAEVDAFVTKADRLGAQRTTIVSVAGFTSPAMRRISELGHLLDAARVRSLHAKDIPEFARTLAPAMAHDDTRDIPLREVPFTHWVYQFEGGTRLVSLADLSLHDVSSACALVCDPTAPPPRETLVALLSRPGGRRTINRFRFTYQEEDGTTRGFQMSRQKGQHIMHAVAEDSSRGLDD